MDDETRATSMREGPAYAVNAIEGCLRAQQAAGVFRRDINRGSVAQGTPNEIKRDRIHAQVIEPDCEPPDVALSTLRDSRLFDEATLYGSTLHLIDPPPAKKWGKRAFYVKPEV